MDAAKANTGGREYDERKFSELVLYVAQKSQTDERFGATKLNKLLFYSDFLAYLKTGTSITGSEYFCHQFGPVPREIAATRQRLVSERHAAIQNVAAFEFTRDRLIALRDPDLSVFTAKEIAIVDDVVDKFRTKCGTEMSQITHRFPGWKYATPGEAIPYYTGCVPSRPIELTEEEIAFGEQLAARINSAA